MLKDADLQTKNLSRLDGSDICRGKILGISGDMLVMEQPDNKRGRPERKFVDVTMEDMQRAYVTEDDAGDRKK